MIRRHPRTCIFTKRNGEKCKNYRYGDSEYCYIHSFGHFRKIPIIKNPLLHFILILLALIFSICAILQNCQYQSESRKFQSAIIEKQQQIIDALNKSMDDINDVESETFNQTYPSGYRLFGQTENVFVPGPIEGIEDYEIRWETVDVLNITSDEIIIQLPDTLYIPNHISSSKVIISVPRNSFEPYLSTINIFPDRFYVQIVEDTRDTIIFLIGLMPKIP